MKAIKGLLMFALTSLLVVLVGLAVWEQIKMRVPAAAGQVTKLTGVA